MSRSAHIRPNRARYRDARVSKRSKNNKPGNHRFSPVITGPEETETMAYFAGAGAGVAVLLVVAALLFFDFL